jgi:hypothetical protein
MKHEARPATCLLEPSLARGIPYWVVLSLFPFPSLFSFLYNTKNTSPVSTPAVQKDTRIHIISVQVPKTSPQNINPSAVKPHRTTNQDNKSRVLTTTFSSTTTVATPPYTCTCTFAHTTSMCHDIQPIHSPLYLFQKKVLLSILGFLSSYAPYDGANPGHTRPNGLTTNHHARCPSHASSNALRSTRP